MKQANIHFLAVFPIFNLEIIKKWSHASVFVKDGCTEKKPCARDRIGKQRLKIASEKKL